MTFLAAFYTLMSKVLGLLRQRKAVLSLDVTFNSTPKTAINSKPLIAKSSTDLKGERGGEKTTQGCKTC